MKLEPIVCPNCGGRVNRAIMKCEYCGTTFESKRDGMFIKYDIVKPGVRTLAVEVGLPREVIHNLEDDGLRHYVQDAMVHKLAQAFVPMLDINVMPEYSYGGRVSVQGRIRIVEPGYKFN